MDLKHTIIAKNASILVVTDIVSKLLRTVLAIMIARKLGASDLGLLAYAIAFSELFSFLPGFGLKNFINREVAKHPEKSGRYFSNLVFAKLILSLATCFIILITSYILKMGPEIFTIVIITSSIMIFDSFLVFYTAFFRGFQKAEYEALILISVNFLVASTGIVIIGLGYGLLIMMIVRLIVTTMIFIAGFIILKMKILIPPFSLQKSFCIRLLKSASPFTVLSILIIINAHIGIVLLTQLKGTLYTGWYIAALKLCGIFQFIPASVAGAILPAMTKFAKEENMVSLYKTYQKSVKYLLMLVLPIAVGTCLLSKKIILLIYTEDFVQSIFTLRILIWLIVLAFTNTIFNAAFSSIGREKDFVRIQILGSILNISLCLLLIPRIGHNGVAVATVSSQLGVFILASIGISNYYQDSKIISLGFKPILATLTMGTFIIFISNFNIFIVVPIAVVIYCFSLFMFKSFDDEELAVLRVGVTKLFPVIRKFI